MASGHVKPPVSLVSVTVLIATLTYIYTILENKVLLVSYLSLWVGLTVAVVK